MFKNSIKRGTFDCDLSDASDDHCTMISRDDSKSVHDRNAEESAVGNRPIGSKFSDDSLSNCGDLLAFSREASRYQNRRSKMQLDTRTMYALVADSLCEVLLPDNHIPSHLEVKNLKLTVRNNYDLERVGRGFRVEGRLHEILEICDNHHAQGPTSLLLYIKSMTRMLASNLVFEISSSLIRKYRPDTPETVTELKNDTSLRVVYVAMVNAIERKEKYPDDERNSAVLLFVLRNEALHKAILQRDYDAFLKEMHIATIKDSMETHNILASAIQIVLPTIRTVYNTFLTCIMSLASGDMERHPKQKQYLLNTATACINYLLPFSMPLSETVAKLPSHNANENEVTATPQHVLSLLRAMKGNIKSLASLVEIPKMSYSSPVIYNSDHGLEKIAATLLVLYPGVLVSGDQILLQGGKPYLINLGTNRIDADHPCFTRISDGKYSSQEETIVSDIRSIFASIQELVPHMDWNIFIEELRIMCTNLRNETFATNAQIHILEKLKSNLPRSNLFDAKLPIVAYESILPRVNDILHFLDNKHLLEATQRYIKLVYGLRTNIFSTEDFLEISGYKKAEEESCKDATPIESKELFATIDRNYKCFETSISVPKLRSQHTPTPVTDTGKPYKISKLCPKKRQKLIKTLSRRSPHYVLLRELYYITLPIVALCAIVIAYFFLTPLMPLKTVIGAVVFSVALFLAALTYKKMTHRKCYLMSIGKEIRDADVKYKYFPDAEERIHSISNDNAIVGFIEHPTHQKHTSVAQKDSATPQKSLQHQANIYEIDASKIDPPTEQKTAEGAGQYCEEGSITEQTPLTNEILEVSATPENCSTIAR